MTYPPVIEGQDDPVLMDFVMRKNTDWRVEFDWEDSMGTDILVADMVMTCVWDSSLLAGVFPPALSSDGDSPGISLEAGSIVFQIPATVTDTFDFVTVAHQIHLTDNAGKKRIWGLGRTRFEAGP